MAVKPNYDPNTPEGRLAFARQSWWLRHKEHHVAGELANLRRAMSSLTLSLAERKELEAEIAIKSQLLTDVTSMRKDAEIKAQIPVSVNADPNQYMATGYNPVTVVPLGDPPFIDPDGGGGSDPGRPQSHGGTPSSTSTSWSFLGPPQSTPGLGFGHNRDAAAESAQQKLEDLSASVGIETEGFVRPGTDFGERVETGPSSFYSPSLRLHDVVEYERRAGRSWRKALIEGLRGILSVREDDSSDWHESRDALNWAREATQVGWIGILLAMPREMNQTPAAGLEISAFSAQQTTVRGRLGQSYVTKEDVQSIVSSGSGNSLRLTAFGAYGVVRAIQAGVGQNQVWRCLGLLEFTDAVGLIARNGQLTHVAVGKVRSNAGCLVMIDGAMTPEFTRPMASRILVKSKSIPETDLAAALYAAAEGELPGWPADEFRGDSLHFGAEVKGSS